MRHSSGRSGFTAQSLVQNVSHKSATNILVHDKHQRGKKHEFIVGRKEITKK